VGGWRPWVGQGLIWGRAPLSPVVCLTFVRDFARLLHQVYRMTGPLRSVRTTGAPALTTLGPCSVIISMRRLSICTAIPNTVISSAAAKPTHAILRWVERSAVYIDQFIAISNARAYYSGVTLEKRSFVSQCIRLKPPIQCAVDHRVAGFNVVTFLSVLRIAYKHSKDCYMARTAKKLVTRKPWSKDEHRAL
jgi:hypothetical protein